MKVLLAGSSGMIGQAVRIAMAAGGHDVRVLLRGGSDGPLTWDPGAGRIPPDAVEWADAIISLGGASLTKLPWMKAYKQAILSSRVASTRVIAAAISHAASPPAVWVSASAVGVYGNRPGEELNEDSPRGSGFLSDVVTAWGRLGYPRRALRLREDALAIVRDHDGLVPDTLDALRALPGVGDYTASAVAAFAFGRRTVVIDTNVRRVLARVIGGEALPPPSLVASERRRAEALLPADAATAVTWNVAAMELGALVCVSRGPRCDACPVRDACAWVAAGSPADPLPRRGQTWHGTDRQCRGTLLAALRDVAETGEPVAEDDLVAAWPRDRTQAERCLAGLLADGLAHAVAGGFTL